MPMENIEVIVIPHCHHSEQYHAHAVSTITNNDPYRYRIQSGELQIRNRIGVRALSVRNKEL